MMSKASRTDGSSSITYTTGRTGRASAMAGIQWQHQMEFPMLGRLHAEGAPMSFGDRAADRQPQSHAIRFARGKRTEKMLSRGGRDSRPVIGDGNAQPLGAIAVDVDSDLAATWRVFLKRVDRIADEVAKDQLNLQAVDV